LKKPAAARRFSSSGDEPRLVGLAKDLVFGVIQGLRERRAVAIGIVVGLVIAFTVIVVVDFFRVRSLASFAPNVPTKIYDKNNVLVAELFKQKREVVPLKKMSPHLVHAFIAIEDNEFYEHHGINIKGIVRAFFINIFSGRIRQGGSTITQQVSKILLTSGERTIFRKIKEAIIALMMEVFYTKDEIMELYLNQIFLGHGTYGVESAAEFYFNKDVGKLNLAECALLATLPSSPNTYSPIRYPERALDRHKIVLARMVEMGFITIPEAEKSFLAFWPDFLYYINELPPTINAMSNRVDKAPWFTEYIRRTLVKKYGEEKVYEDGLSVYTTLDVNKQMAGQRLLKNALERQTSISNNLMMKRDDIIQDNFAELVDIFSHFFPINPIRRTGSLEVARLNDALRDQVVDETDMLNYISGTDRLGEMLDVYRKDYSEDREFQKVEGCLISIDHRNGYIEALVGGSEFTSINQLNRVMQSYRQPGSSIKPLLYTAAMESKKFTPATGVLDSPLVFIETDGSDWIPENYEGDYTGMIRLRKALALSVNVVSIRIADTIGISRVANYYQKLLKMNDDEAKRRIRRDLSIALGSIEVSPYELTRAFGIIANGGRDVIPFSIRYITDRKGNTLENYEQDVKKQLEEKAKEGTIQIIRPETAQVMISMMQSVITGGTGGAANLGRPVAGKTGTTNNWKDAWFVGFTPQLTTGMWMGYDKMGLSLGLNQTGGGVVAPVWGEYMKAAMQGAPASDFPGYAGLSKKEVCALSGMALSGDCKNSVSEIFIPGSEPTEKCKVCKDGGRNAKMLLRSPGENISGSRKGAVLENLQQQKGDKPIINNIGKDLLE